jgi:hypothetical protein
VIDLLNKDFMAIDLAAYGANPVDRDVRVIGKDDIVAGVRDVLVIDEVTLIGEEVTEGPGVNT